MAHWAQIDENNLVIQVTVGDNNDPNGDEGYQWLVDNVGGTWIKYSYNTSGGVHLLGGTPLRKNAAAIGMFYDPNLDAFIYPKPPLGETPITKKVVDWVLNEETCLWDRVVLD